MPKPEFSSLSAAHDVLSLNQALLLLVADRKAGSVHELETGTAPEWLIQQCRDLGLLAPGLQPGSWSLTPDGHNARSMLMGTEPAFQH